MAFADYLDIVEKGTDSDLRIFFNPFKLVPNCWTILITPTSPMDVEDFPYTFFGCAGSDVRLHYDIDLSHVFLTQFGGTKRITLFDRTRRIYTSCPSPPTALQTCRTSILRTSSTRSRATSTPHPWQTPFMPSGIWHYIDYIDGSFSLSLRALSESHLYRLKGAYKVFVIRKLDYFINKYYKNLWSDFKLKRAIAKAQEIIDERENERQNRLKASG